MNFESLFRKSSANPKKPRVFRVSSHNVAEILRLWDACDDTRSRVARYHLWTRIHELVPETKEGSWSLNVLQSTKLELVENL